MDIFSYDDFPGIEWPNQLARPNNSGITPCPWCKNSDKFIVLSESISPTTYKVGLKCTVCGCIGPQKLTVCTSSFYALSPLEIAIFSGWNDRATDEEFEQMRAENANLLLRIYESQEWQPIHTAPFDGRTILGLDVDGRCYIMSWRATNNNDSVPSGTTTWRTVRGFTLSPLMWRPL